MSQSETSLSTRAMVGESRAPDAIGISGFLHKMIGEAGRPRYWKSEHDLKREIDQIFDDYGPERVKFTVHRDEIIEKLRCRKFLVRRDDGSYTLRPTPAS